MDPIIARKTWRTLEPVHGLVYFASEAHQAYSRLGLDTTSGYFASRSAALGPVGPEVVIATFFNFNPDLVRSCLPAAWDIVSPEQVGDARSVAAGAAIERVLGDEVGTAAMAEAAALAERAAEATLDRPEGRPLFAAHAVLGWPDAPHRRLWHAQMLLREFRGDGHIALLTTEGITGIEALVLHAATGLVSRAGLQRTRSWNDAAWEDANESLRVRGLVDREGAFTSEGAALREHIEDRTDALALAPYEALGDQACERLRAVVRPWSRVLAAALFS